MQPHAQCSEGQGRRFHKFRPGVALLVSLVKRLVDVLVDGVELGAQRTPPSSEFGQSVDVLAGCHVVECSGSATTMQSMLWVNSTCVHFAGWFVSGLGLNPCWRSSGRGAETGKGSLIIMRPVVSWAN